MVADAAFINLGWGPVSMRDHRYFRIFPNYNGIVIIELEVKS
jgi:hypothetical protein